jgi:hypothetical protein
LAGARVHLASGHDVVVPQLLARPAFIDQAAALASLMNSWTCGWWSGIPLGSKESAVLTWMIVIVEISDHPGERHLRGEA